MEQNRIEQNRIEQNRIEQVKALDANMRNHRDVKPLYIVISRVTEKIFPDNLIEKAKSRIH